MPLLIVFAFQFAAHPHHHQRQLRLLQCSYQLALMDTMWTRQAALIMACNGIEMGIGSSSTLKAVGMRRRKRQSRREVGIHWAMHHLPTLQQSGYVRPVALGHQESH